MAIPPIDIPKTFLAPKISDKRPPMKKINIIDTRIMVASVPFLLNSRYTGTGPALTIVQSTRVGILNKTAGFNSQGGSGIQLQRRIRPCLG